MMKNNKKKVSFKRKFFKAQENIPLISCVFAYMTFPERIKLGSLTKTVRNYISSQIAKNVYIAIIYQDIETYKDAMLDLYNKEGIIVNMQMKPSFFVEINKVYENIRNEDLKLFFLRRILRKYKEYLKSKINKIKVSS